MSIRLRHLMLLAGSLGAVACGMGEQRPPRLLDPALPWYGNNAQRLDEFIARYGVAGPSYSVQQKPVAIFDWDNTIIKNDIGDATLYYMLNGSKVLQPPDSNWRRTSPYLTAEAAAMLNAACDGLAPPGQPLPTATSSACATEIVTIYNSGKTTTGKPAFGGWNWRRMEPAYAWAVQLLAGYTPAEIRGFTEAAIAFNLANPIGATQTVGAVGGLNAYIRVYDQIQDLMGVMQENGFDVWISSASAQPVVEAFAARVQVAPSQVLGVRLLTDPSGRLTYDLEGCGDVPDGKNDGLGNVTGNSLINYIDGKRCWANKIIWGDRSAAALEPSPDLGRRPVFGAGDSSTDVTFLRDTTVLKLVINRNKKELMCNGYGNYGGKYLINPMFISPRPQLPAGYPCATTACVDPAGAAVPCFDEATPPTPIADQKDSVFAP